MVFDQIHNGDRGEVVAEVMVYAGMNGSTRLLLRGNVNLTSTRGRQDTARFLRERMPFDWGSLLEPSSWRVVDAYRQGRPGILLREAKPPPGGSAVLPPLLLARQNVAGFGDGGTLKSYFALAAGVSIHTGREVIPGLRPTATMPVAYLDWEWDEWEHKKRLRALWPDRVADDQLPGLVYVPCQAEGPLVHQIDRLRRIFAQHHIGYAILDSVALACAGPPEDAQVALAFFQALARLEVGSFLLAHVNRSGDSQKPFGSAFWHNSARATWNFQRVQEEESSELDLGLFHRKANAGPRQRPIGLHFSMALDREGEPLRTIITRADLNEVPELAKGIPLKDRIVVAIRPGALTIKELADRLDVAPEVIRMTVKRHTGKTFTIISGDPYRVGNLA
jgi:hypothetical protein